MAINEWTDSSGNSSAGDKPEDGYNGIPEPTDYSGSIRVTLDGKEIMTGSGEDQRSDPDLFPSIFKIPLELGNELKITIEGNQKVWDVGYKRMQYFWN